MVQEKNFLRLITMKTNITQRIMVKIAVLPSFNTPFLPKDYRKVPFYTMIIHRLLSSHGTKAEQKKFLTMIDHRYTTSHGK